MLVYYTGRLRTVDFIRNNENYKQKKHSFLPYFLCLIVVLVIFVLTQILT